MRVLSLFSGIGGLDLGLERAGMTVVAQSEVDAYASRVLAKHWPDVPNLGDITKITEADIERLGPIDLVCGGPPCQPVSLVGPQRGTADGRWLWDEFWRICGLVRPRYAIAENPPALLTRPQWMGAVLDGATSIGGFRCVEWDCVPACALGAPQRRDRAWIIAHASHGDGEHVSGRPLHLGWPRPGRTGDLAHSAGWTTEPGIRRTHDGVPDWTHRLRGLGNAVVPQVAEHVGRIIMDLAEERRPEQRQTKAQPEADGPLDASR